MAKCHWPFLPVGLDLRRRYGDKSRDAMVAGALAARGAPLHGSRSGAMQAARRQAIGRRWGWPVRLAHRRLARRAGSSPDWAAGLVARSLRLAEARCRASEGDRSGTENIYSAQEK